MEKPPGAPGQDPQESLTVRLARVGHFIEETEVDLEQGKKDADELRAGLQRGRALGSLTGEEILEMETAIKNYEEAAKRQEGRLKDAKIVYDDLTERAKKEEE